MAIVKKKTKKKLKKSLKKVVRKHGADVATALVVSIITGLADSKPSSNIPEAVEEEAAPVESGVSAKSPEDDQDRQASAAVAAG